MTYRPLLLDGFCKAGGAGAGYYRAGFEVVGVDAEPQKRYPFEFVRSDFFEFVAEHGREFDMIHASPPCQAYSQARNLLRLKSDEGCYLDLVADTRSTLQKVGRPYVIENVVGAPLLNPIRLCGSSFGLDVRRHRLFESSHLIFGLSCNHDAQEPRFPPANPHRTNLMRVISVFGHSGIQPGVTKEMRARAMGIDWMTNSELSQAIPPAYTEHVGMQLLWHLEGVA